MSCLKFDRQSNVIARVIMENRLKTDLEDLIRRGVVAFYGYQEVLPDVLSSKEAGRVKVLPGDISGVQMSDADVCFLDREALRALAVKFPMRPRYVLARLALRPGWFWGLPGLLRRLLIGQMTFRGTATMRMGERSQYWLVIQKTAEHQSGPAFLSEKVGVQGLLDHLRREKVNYVVLKFYEKLPELHREGGDLDILVADEDEAKVREFIREHPGTIGIDIFSAVSPGREGIPHFPPPLARRILQSAVSGPAGSRIPGPKEAFLSFAYHVLYHEGFRAGIPSTLPGAEVDPDPKNDYLGALRRMAEELGIGVALNLEGLDEYLSAEGWRPMRDTLAILAERNEWVRRRFFSAQPMKEVGLGVFVLRQSPDGTDRMDSLLELIQKDKFLIIRSKKLDEAERERAARHLRGGNWAEKKDLNRNGAFLPVAVAAVLDLHFPYSGGGRAPGGYSRLRALKEKLRKRFDAGEASLVHSTDNTAEAWDYIEVCFPEETEDIRGEVDRLTRDLRLPLRERTMLYFRALPYLLKRTIFRARSAIVRYLEKK